jgi:hypothetical protein
MLGTSLTYFILQGPGIFVNGDPDSVVAAHEHVWSALGFFVCIGLFSAYMWYQYKIANSDDQVFF